jgi:hypothetical protein
MDGDDPVHMESEKRKGKIMPRIQTRNLGVRTVQNTITALN